ncbi:MAG: DEAD/DEAH box helicase [Candidatus Lokiarchaeota archaeon]|nr:DEAD/DEAH box helicase [Candidatus Lokiarchaeota archaeon]
MTQSYVNWKFLNENLIKERKYQLNIVDSAFMSNTLVVLPTALGKTIIGILLTVKHLKKYNGKVLVLAPTRPLVSQHYNKFKQFINNSISMNILIGGLSPLQRTLKVNNSQIIFATPQIIKNDISSGAYNLKNFTLIIFDEAHHARHNYAYTFIADEYIFSSKTPHILGLTASPGKNIDRINNLVEKLRIEKVCFKTEEDNDVKEYIYPIDVYIDRVDLPIEIVEIQVIIDRAIHEIIDYLMDYKLITPKRYYSKMDFLALSHDVRLFEYCNHDDYKDEYNFPTIFDALSANHDKIPDHITMINAGIYWYHLQELLTTQCPQLFHKYYEKLSDRAESNSRSAQKVVHSKYFRNFINEKLSFLLALDSPKIRITLNIIQSIFATKPDAKIIIFTQFRDMASIITDRINTLDHCNISAARFVGQSSKFEDIGLSQSMQQELIEYFKTHKISVLVATSIAEEGLDIPNVDCVIFYEPVPSEIRLIQRRGRTGRSSKGNCHILCVNDSLDDIFLKVSFRKEQNMKNLLTDNHQLDLYSSINRNPEKFALSVKNDEEIYQFFQDIAERRKITTQKEIDMIKELLELEGEKKRTSNLKRYGVRDLTQELNKLTVTRLQRKDSNLQHLKEEKKNEIRQRRSQKIEDKIKSFKKNN